MSEPDDPFSNWVPSIEELWAELQRLLREKAADDALITELYEKLDRLTHGGRRVDTARNDRWLAVWSAECARGRGDRRSKEQKLERVAEQWCQEEKVRDGRRPRKPASRTVDRGIHEAPDLLLTMAGGSGLHQCSLPRWRLQSRATDAAASP
jgi:hypothetical protein